MADEVLSPAEITDLMDNIKSDEGGVINQETPEASTQSVQPVAAALQTPQRVTPYDFKRPERVGKDQMRALQTMHEGFSRNFGAVLSAELRQIVEVRLTSVDQLTYSEFVFSLENPTCFNLLRAEPLAGHLILDINPSILYPIIDRMLGGGKDAGPISRRPLTEIELRLVNKITQKFLREMEKAWLAVIDLELSVERVESNPQLVQIVPPNEVVILITFEITVGELRGMMNLCIPFNSIERVSNRLTSNSWGSYGRGGATAQTREAIGNRLDQAVVEMVVTLAEARLRTSDLLELRVGDIITTDHDAQTPLEVAIEGVPHFRASPGAFRGRKAVEVQEVLQKKQAAPSE